MDVLECKRRSSIVGKEEEIREGAVVVVGVETRFVSARRASNVGRRSRGPSGVLEFGGLRRDKRGGRAEVGEGEAEEPNIRAGLTEMRMRDRAWADGWGDDWVVVGVL